MAAWHYNSGYKVGDRFIIDVDSNFVTKLCLPRLCVYLMEQMQVPVALINGRVSGSYGEVMVEVSVVPRVK